MSGSIVFIIICVSSLISCTLGYAVGHKSGKEEGKRLGNLKSILILEDVLSGLRK